MQIKTFVWTMMWAALAVSMAQTGSLNSSKVIKVRRQNAEDRIQIIQTGYQQALEDLTLTKARMVSEVDPDGKKVMVSLPPSFGLDREPHLAIVHGTNLRETSAQAYGDETNYQVKFYAVAATGKPLTTRDMHVQKYFGPYAMAGVGKQVLAFASHSLPSLEKVNVVKGKIGGLYAEARPLRLTRKECLPCHTESKVGDPLAILIYTVEYPKG